MARDDESLKPTMPTFNLRSSGGCMRPTAKMMRRDQERVGVAYRNEEGLYADFHANRHTFVSNLGQAGVTPKLAQSLGRHSDISLTMNVYTHLELDERASAVTSLPAPLVALLPLPLGSNGHAKTEARGPVLTHPLTKPKPVSVAIGQRPARGAKIAAGG